MTVHTNLGPVLVEGDAAYDRERAAWNLLHQHHPELIVVPTKATDVESAIAYAAERGLPIAVQGTGHGQTVPADDGMLINLRRLTEFSVDPTARTARVQAGVTWGPLLEEAARHGLAPLVGSSITVGVIGYLTGGGLPVLGRRFGYAADHVRSLELVTPDGRRRVVSPDHEPDLFWGVRGGSCNFGVVTAAEIDLISLPRLYGGQLVYPGAAAGDVLAAWLEWSRGLPEEMCSSIALVRVPDAPIFPAEIRGQFIVIVRIAYVGDPADGAALTAPLRALNPMLDAVAAMSAGQIPQIHADPTDPLPAVDRAFRTGDLDAPAVAQILELAGPDAVNPPMVFEIRQLGGALARPPRVANCTGLRHAAYVVNLPTVAAEPHLVDLAHRAQDAVVEGLRPWRVGGPHPNFVSASAVAAGEVEEAYDPDDYARLRQLKRTWDPANMFRLNRNIPPARSHAIVGACMSSRTHHRST